MADDSTRYSLTYNRKEASILRTAIIKRIAHLQSDVGEQDWGTEHIEALQRILERMPTYHDINR